MSSTYESMWLWSRVNWLQARYYEGNFAPLGMIADFPVDLADPAGWLPTDGSWRQKSPYQNYVAALSPTNNLTAVTPCSLFIEDGTTAFSGTTLQSEGNYLTDTATPGSIFVQVNKTTWKRVVVPDATANTYILAVSSGVYDTTTQPLGVLVLELGPPHVFKFHVYSNGSWSSPDLTGVTVVDHTTEGNYGFSPTPSEIRFIDGDKHLWKWTIGGSPALTRFSDGLTWWAGVKDLFGEFVGTSPYLRPTNFQTDYFNGDEGVLLFNVLEEGSWARLRAMTSDSSMNWGSNQPLDHVFCSEGDPDDLGGYWCSRNPNWTDSMSSLNVWVSATRAIDTTYMGAPLIIYPTQPVPNFFKGENVVGTQGFTGNAYFTNANGSSNLNAAFGTFRVMTDPDNWENRDLMLLSLEPRKWWALPPTLFTHTPKGFFSTYGPDSGDRMAHYVVLHHNEGDSVVLLDLQNLDQFKLPTSTAPAGLKRMVMVDGGWFPNFSLSTGGGGGGA